MKSRRMNESAAVRGILQIVAPYIQTLGNRTLGNGSSTALLLHTDVHH